MRIKDIKAVDLKNGDGLRTSIWFAGCEHRCKNCQNPNTWDENDGDNFTDYKDYLYKCVNNPDIQGITLTGGDPLFSKNRKEILEFLKEFKSKFPEKDIWCYTGYTYEWLLADDICLEILDFIDVLVDGPYIEEQRNVDLYWRGSANQRVIDIKKSRNSSQVVLFCE